MSDDPMYEVYEKSKIPGIDMENPEIKDLGPI